MNKESEIKIFSLMAGIEEPWILERVEVAESNGRLWRIVHRYEKEYIENI